MCGELCANKRRGYLKLENSEVVEMADWQEVKESIEGTRNEGLLIGCATDRMGFEVWSLVLTPRAMWRIRGSFKKACAGYFGISPLWMAFSAQPYEAIMEARK